MGSRCKRSTLALARMLAARCSSYATPTTDVLVLGYLMDYERAMGRISVPANRELCWRHAPIWADMDPRFLWKASGDEVRVFNWTGKNDYVALCEPESISFGGGCDTVLFLPPCFPLPPLTCQCWRLTCFFLYHRDGHYGLYLDETLYEGSSARCPTFNNDPLCTPDTSPSKGSDGSNAGTATFECVGLEVWGVGLSS